MKKYLDSTICWPLAIILFILCLISCYTIKCAAGYITYPNPTGYWSKQLLYYMIGVGLIFLTIVLEMIEFTRECGFFMES